jgi:hypothetical protein
MFRKLYPCVDLVPGAPAALLLGITEPHCYSWTVTTHVQNLLVLPNTSLTLSSSLLVERLTQRCYIWSNKDYKLALTHLNFQSGIKPINYNSTCHMGQQHNYYRLLMHWGVTFTPLRVDAPSNSPHMQQTHKTIPWYTPPWAHAARVDAMKYHRSKDGKHCVCNKLVGCKVFSMF